MSTIAMSTNYKTSLASFALFCLLGGASCAATGTAGLDRSAPARASKLETGDQAGALVRGRKVYDNACVVCHATAIANAPPPGDKAAWEPRNKQGFEVLVRHAIDGFRGASAKRGDAGLVRRRGARRRVVHELGPLELRPAALLARQSGTPRACPQA